MAYKTLWDLPLPTSSLTTLQPQVLEHQSLYCLWAFALAVNCWDALDAFAATHCHGSSPDHP